MNINQDKGTFKDAITATAQSLNISEVLIEKDYWVTKTLMNLSRSKHRDKVVFKGGTSLSKAYNLIDRFSEDIDLAVIIENKSSNQIQKLIRSVEKEIVLDLKEIVIDGITSKGSKYRKTVYEYPKETALSGYGQASDKLLIEVNSFTKPHPHEEMPIQSYIGQYLLSQNQEELLERYKLRSFDLKVLALERTFVEKVLGIVRLSYEENNVDKLKKKVRHLYDLHQLNQDERITTFLSSKSKIKEMINLVKMDDRNNHEFTGEWIDNPIHQSPFFKENLHSHLASTYNGDFKSLIFGELPSFASVESSLYNIAECIGDL